MKFILFGDEYRNKRKPQLKYACLRRNMQKDKICLSECVSTSIFWKTTTLV